jgi:phosphatidylserine decarboxylase
MRVRWEQFRQARRIHGGFPGLLTAWLGVQLSRVPIPTRTLRRKVFSTVYGGRYPALDEAELEKPLEEFRSLNELFTRGVREDQRPISNRSAVLLSPVDGTIQETGTIGDDFVLRVKGIPYSLESLCPESDVQSFRGGQFAALFLSPRDCHRVFSPAAVELTRLVHVPGRRLLVHPPYQRAEFPVFVLNERLVMDLRTERGRILAVLVAGWGVGCLTHPFAAPLQLSSRRVTACELLPAVKLSRGEWMATFELGSTVILLMERGMAGPCEFPAGTAIRCRTPLFELKPAMEGEGGSR